MSESTQTRRPNNSRFQQQKLPAWQPILTAGNVSPLFFVIGVVFVPLGISLLVISNQTEEITINYTNCEASKETVCKFNTSQSNQNPSEPQPTTKTTSERPTTKKRRVIQIPENKWYPNNLFDDAFRSNSANNGSDSKPSEPNMCKDLVKAGNATTCTCQIPFELHRNLTGQVFIYYALTAFFQNHRRYLNSKDDRQLSGDPAALNYNNPVVPKDDHCSPFRYVNNKDKKDGIYLPCGAVANSLFSDEIKILQNGTTELPLTSEGILWQSDLSYKFKNPSWWPEAKGNPAHPAWKVFKKPKAWRKELWELEDGIQNKDLIAWMRTAALPNFRKLYRIVDSPDGLSMGNYTLCISYAFPVAEFNGTKSIIIATTNLIGGKNSFIGIAYTVVGATCLILSAIFFVLHLTFGQRQLLPTQNNQNTEALQPEHLSPHKGNDPTPSQAIASSSSPRKKSN